MTAARLDFVLPADLQARAPAEARGVPRDGVDMLVSHAGSGDIQHHVFRDLPRLLRPGDLLVVNNSATLPAALSTGPVPGLGELVVHLSTGLPDGTWVVEPRRPADGSSRQLGGADATALRPGTRLPVADGEVVLVGRYTPRLWVAEIAVPGPVPAYLADHGRPIRYGYTDRDWPLATYQNVFATVPGSAEMPSAGRPFTGAVLADLVARGVLLAPITLHTGVASPEAEEKPYPEWFAVPEPTAALVRHVRATGGRVVAVGTTVVRALESATDETGVITAGGGWTDVVITPERGVRVVDGLLTGLHEPRASHLLMLAAITGETLLRRCYAAALAHRYLWHEFGDVHLLLP